MDAQRGHIVIAGPGRSGTTLLVELLAAIGLETETRGRYHDHARAGLESGLPAPDLLAPDAPHVVKRPALCSELGHRIDRGEVDPALIDWLVVPVRELDDAAASRVAVALEQRSVGNVPGGLVGTTRPGKQRQYLAESLYELTLTAARYGLPVLLIEYPRFGTDWVYAYERLSPMLDVDEDRFAVAWRSVVNGDFVNAEVPMPRLAELRAIPWRVQRFAGLKWMGVKGRLASLIG